MKRRSPKYRRRIAQRLLLRRIDIQTRNAVAKKSSISMPAPSCFSIIDNTAEVLQYFSDCRTKLHNKENILFDIRNVSVITPDAIALLVACTNDDNFRGKYSKIEGNEPKLAEPRKLFEESGFYNFVNSSKETKYSQKSSSNLLHKESHFSVRSDIAKEACLYGTNHVFKNANPIPELYEILVEAMSNTNNHASSNFADKTKWWLYTYNNPDGTTSYSFVDLGVGIFNSLPVKAYKKLWRKMIGAHNVDLVEDLLNGKIKSREKVDNELRGKGIPQIAYNSQAELFRRAYIITNDVKINLKTRLSEKLAINLHGTFIYIELALHKKLLDS